MSGSEATPSCSGKRNDLTSSNRIYTYFAI
nr:MAG TPA: hypothetical protein [Caudoviricetes sp.]